MRSEKDRKLTKNMEDWEGKIRGEETNADEEEEQGKKNN